MFQNNVATQTLSRHQLSHTYQQHTKLTLKPFEKIFKNNDRGNKFYQISKTEKKIKLKIYLSLIRKETKQKYVRTL